MKNYHKVVLWWDKWSYTHVATQEILEMETNLAHLLLNIFFQ